ncbi:MAG TPA: hypothetical protein VEO95_06360 [Chthoniobacteraceae bacterium]|nr:hypothetical protein [Chthoniobacteraceae bacterium]
MDAPKQIETAQPTPEQLLTLLELQIAGERSNRAHKSRNRATFLVTGILLIIAGACIALFVAGQLLAEVQERGARASAGVPSEAPR